MSEMNVHSQPYGDSNYAPHLQLLVGEYHHIRHVSSDTPMRYVIQTRASRGHILTYHTHCVGFPNLNPHLVGWLGLGWAGPSRTR